MRLLIGLFEIQIFNELSLEILLIVIACSTKYGSLKFALITVQEHVFKIYVLKPSASDFMTMFLHTYNTLREKNMLQPNENLKARSHFRVIFPKFGFGIKKVSI